ncbi:MAG: RNA-binding S4 domain-containing protein [Bergeyella sp.]|nr:RNA-binding S4 domain-containing protein [Bergeyella sp.]
MRIDKFLWSVRIYKTRSIAAEEIKKNRVSVYDKVAKNAKDVKEDDLISIRKKNIELKIKVLQIPKSRIGAKLIPDYIEDKTDPSQYEMLELKKIQQDYYRNKGEGRPTKKDRRNLYSLLGRF